MSEGNGIQTQAFHSARYSQAANTTQYLHFTDDATEAVIFTGGRSTKRGVYLYGSAGSGGVGALTTVYASTGTGQVTLSVPTDTNAVKIENGSTAAYILVIVFRGSLPTLSSTAPS